MAERGETDGCAALPPSERRRRNREQVVASILDAARAVMRERGVADLSLREVARRVAMRAPSLYEYFPSKLALYDALFLLGIHLFQECCDAKLADRSAFWDVLEALFEVNLSFAREHQDLHQLIFERPVPGFVPSEASMAASQRLLDDYHGYVAAAIDAGEIAPGLPTSQTRDLTIAMMQGVTSQHVANDPDAAPGTGRYGGLVGPAIALFRAAWPPRALADAAEAASPGPVNGTRRKEVRTSDTSPQESA